MRSIPYAGEAGGYVTVRMCGPAQPLKRTPIGRELDLIWLDLNLGGKHAPVFL
jgi:hypothetical protein